MTNIPQRLLVLATEAVLHEEAHTFSHVTHVDSDHAPIIAAAALEPVLTELRRQVAREIEAHALARDAATSPEQRDHETGALDGLRWVLAQLVTGGSDE